MDFDLLFQTLGEKKADLRNRENYVWIWRSKATIFCKILLEKHIQSKNYCSPINFKQNLIKDWQFTMP